MYNNDENPRLIDTNLYTFHVEYHVRDTITDIFLHKGNTNNTVINVLEMRAGRSYHWMTQKGL